MLDVPEVARPSAARRLLVAAVALAALTAGAACSSGGAADGDDAGSAGDQAPTPEPPFATGRRSLTLVDESRPTAAVPDRFPERPDRTLEVEVVYPAAGDAGPDPAGEPIDAGASVVDATPADGAFPLVVFAHGWNGRADHFRGFAERWARAGYVVALPTFPLSQEGIAVDDLAAQTGDVSFVIDELTGLDAEDPLAGVVDGERIAVGGHSLGAATVFGVAYNSCCVDERIDAAIPVSGGTLPIEGGDYEDPPATPMLLVHGAADEGVPIAAGDAMFEIFDGPTWYLRAEGATHMGIFEGEPGRLFNEATLAFLDARFRDDDEALAAMGERVPTAGEWRTKP